MDQQACKTKASNMLMLPKEKSKIAELIGKKCVKNCFVNRAVHSILGSSWGKGSFRIKAMAGSKSSRWCDTRLFYFIRQNK